MVIRFHTLVGIGSGFILVGGSSRGQPRIIFQSVYSKLVAVQQYEGSSIL